MACTDEEFDLTQQKNLMDKDDLFDLAGNPAFISGIYNYCDRWCERCPFTSRCLLYATEQQDPDLADPETRDITNEKFWRKLQAIFASTARMIAEHAAEAGIDLDAVDVTEEMAAQERDEAEAKQNELSLAAKHYARMTEDWFKQEFAGEEVVHDDTAVASASEDKDLTIGDAIEVIRWYQFFIAAKIFRALTGGRRAGEQTDEEDNLFGTDFSAEGEEDFDYEAVLAKTARMDANGSAKVALIALDRSISAWRTLQVFLPEKADTIMPILIDLDRLRRTAELRFPQARDFIRPGLDEAFSEFVS